MFLEQSNEERSRSSFLAAITPLTSDADHLKRRIGLHGLLLPILYMSGVLFAFRRLRYPCGLLYGLLCVAGEGAGTVGLRCNAKQLCPGDIPPFGSVWFRNGQLTVGFVDSFDRNMNFTSSRRPNCA